MRGLRHLSAAGARRSEGLRCWGPRGVSVWCWEVGGASAGGTGLLWFWGKLGAGGCEGILYQKVGVQCSVGGEMWCQGGSQCWRGVQCKSREGASVVLDPLLRWGSGGLGAWCSAGGRWWGRRTLSLQTNSPVPGEETVWGSAPQHHCCGAGTNGTAAFLLPQTALSSAGELGGARQGRASSPSLGVCYLLLLSKEWLCCSCSSAGTVCQTGWACL